MSTEPDARYQSTHQPPNADDYVTILAPGETPAPSERKETRDDQSSSASAPEQPPQSERGSAIPARSPEELVQEGTLEAPMVPAELSGVDPTSNLFVRLDGCTHINVYSKGVTELGRLLAHYTFSPFVHPYFGPFNSMEGYWYYIKALKPDDALRTLHGWEAKDYGKKLDHIRRPNFKELVVDANYHKVMQNPRLRDLMRASVLPFDHYYLYGPGSILIRPKGFEWLVTGFEQIRTMVKLGKTPPRINYDYRPQGQR